MNRSEIESAVHAPGASNHDRALFCLALDPKQPRAVAAIRQIASDVGWPKAKTVNIALYLTRARGLAIRTGHGWKLSERGIEYVSQKANLPKKAIATALTGALRSYLPKIKNDDVRTFVEEAITAAESGLHRSAVVLSWVGAVAVLYDHVVATHLADFNAEAPKHDPKWKQARNSGDFVRMKESTFLDVLAAISIIDKTVKGQLGNCLDLRNGCGHPNKLKIAEANVAAYIETLMKNVFERF